MECEQCEKKFASKYTLNRHVNTIHNKTKSYTSDDENNVSASDTDIPSNDIGEGSVVRSDEDQETDSVDETDDDDSEMTDDTASNDDENDGESTTTSNSPWNYFIGETMDDMMLTNKQQVEEQLKKFLPQLQKNTSLHVHMVSVLKRNKLYQQLKEDEARWLKRGFPCDEAIATAWKLRKMTFKKIISQLIE